MFGLIWNVLKSIHRYRELKKCSSSYRLNLYNLHMRTNQIMMKSGSKMIFFYRNSLNECIFFEKLSRGMCKLRWNCIQHQVIFLQFAKMCPKPLKNLLICSQMLKVLIFFFTLIPKQIERALLPYLQALHICFLCC